MSHVTWQNKSDYNKGSLQSMNHMNDVEKREREDAYEKCRKEREDEYGRRRNIAVIFTQMVHEPGSTTYS